MEKTPFQRKGTLSPEDEERGKMLNRVQGLEKKMQNLKRLWPASGETGKKLQLKKKVILLLKIIEFHPLKGYYIARN